MATKELLFVVDTDNPHRKMMAGWLRDQGYRVKVFDNGELCLNMLDENPDAICLDINMSAGLDILKRLKLANRDIPVLVVTENEAVDSAVEAMKIGAFDYMAKPVDKVRLKINVKRAIEMHTMVNKIQRLQGELKETYSYKNIIGQSDAMKQVFAQMDEVSAININVFVHGESGTGKELVAKALHFNSAYKAGDFVAINCGAIPEELQENEFFGHEKGAYTSADDSRMGKLEVANGGTLFLDEVGELPLLVQKAFLRVLQERRFRPVGGEKEVRSDFRLVAATNRDLDALVQSGQFRKDLLYRIRTLNIKLPPLRERIQDIKEIALYHMAKFCERNRIGTKGFSPEFLEALEKYDWPGNVRELINTLETALSAAGIGDTLSIAHLPVPIRIQLARASVIEESGKDTKAEANNPEPLGLPTFREQMRSTEESYLKALLAATRGNIKESCRISGLSRSRLYALLKKHGLSRHSYSL